jgi:hypothetical protein
MQKTDQEKIKTSENPGENQPLLENIQISKL